jgi:hypothetical protein
MENNITPEKDSGGPNFKAYAKYSALIFNMVFIIKKNNYLGY